MLCNAEQNPFWENHSLAPIAQQIHERTQWWQTIQLFYMWQKIQSSLRLKINYWSQTPFNCFECDKQSSGPLVWKSMKQFTKVKRLFNFSICDKKLNWSLSLKIHKLTHNGEFKPLDCFKCGNNYYWSMSLKIHNGTQNGKKLFHCSKCWDNFQWSISLKIY